MRAHALWAAPLEACGLVAVAASQAQFFYACTNVLESSERFTVDPVEQFRAMQHAERHGWEIGASFHSHPGGPLWPSDTDVGGALDPCWVYLIGSNSALRGFSIVAGEVEEVVLHD